MKSFLKLFIPEFILIWYHLVLAHLANFIYGHPSQKLFMVGVTGTKGKTSTANFVWSVLSAGGFKTGQISTANIRIGEQEFLNQFHMTMPSPFIIQKLLRQMVQAGCTHAVMEATSEGMKLYRHLGIQFDCAIFTNLTPEHLPSHGGSFEKYKQVKAKLFQSLKPTGMAIVNADSEHADYYLRFAHGKKFTFGINSGEFQATKISDSNEGINFEVKNDSFNLNILGKFNIYNALPAIALGSALNLPDEKIRQGIEAIKIIPGRMEPINEGQSFRVFVDYAHEPVSMNAVLDTARNLAGKNHVIVLLGAEGGGRDKTKRGLTGQATGSKADFIICSNVDPYDDDPTEIVEEIARAAEAVGKIRDQNLFVIEDRRAGIAKALSLAQPNDVVVITGKGAEQSMIIGNKNIPWDDRKVVREEIKNLE